MSDYVNMLAFGMHHPDILTLKSAIEVQPIWCGPSNEYLSSRVSCIYVHSNMTKHQKRMEQKRSNELWWLLTYTLTSYKSEKKGKGVQNRTKVKRIVWKEHRVPDSIYIQWDRRIVGWYCIRLDRTIVRHPVETFIESMWISKRGECNWHAKHNQELPHDDIFSIESIEYDFPLLCQFQCATCENHAASTGN